jgi:phage terminase large subunit GpA-like protein
LICEVLPAESFLSEWLPAFCPRPIHGTWDWINEHGRMPDGTPFDGNRIPWCKGVCDAFDDPATREIAMQWGTRLGKTTVSMQILAKTAATKPMPGLFATSTQSLAKRIVRNKIYPILNSIRETRKQLPDERWWTVEEIRLKNSPWAVAWSGSDTQLADLSAYYGYANEIDKWSMNDKLGGDAGEGDPLDQFMERFKEFSDAKILFECSPSTKRHSRIEKKLLASNNCRFWVGCPKCGARQVLILGTTNPEDGGILFDRHYDGSMDPAIARQSARYVCVHCHYEIHDDQRPRMMRAGVWAPEGCGVDKRGRLIGEAKRGSRIWGGQLSSLYSLQLRWGDIAEKFVQSVGNPRNLRMFINGWLSETWEPHKSKSEPEEVGERLSTAVARGVIPDWATWLFAAVDIQADHFVFVVIAVGPGERVHLVDDGTCETLDWIETNVIKRQFEHADGKEPLCPALTLIDSGFRTKDVYSFCQRFKGTPHRVQPCKGSNTDCAGEAYELKVIGLNEVNQNARTKKILARTGRGLTRVRVNPYYYEPIIQEQLDEKNPGEDGGFSLHAEAAADIDLMRQLCNGAESIEPSKTDPNRHLWVKRWENEPNDKRDAVKYARCAVDVRFKRNWRLVEQRQGAAPVRPVPAPVVEPTHPERRERFRPELGRRRGR